MTVENPLILPRVAEPGEDERVTVLADATKRLYLKLLDANNGQEVPLKVFLQPCEVIL